MMKGRARFPGILLIFFGIYLFLQETKLPVPEEWHGWPALSVIIGVAFLFQAYKGKDAGFIIPGILLCGWGIHRQLANRLRLPDDPIGILFLLFSLGFFLYGQKVKGVGRFGGLFLLLAVLQLFHDDFLTRLASIGVTLPGFRLIFSLLLAATGVYLFFFRKNKRGISPSFNLPKKTVHTVNSPFLTIPRFHPFSAAD